MDLGVLRDHIDDIDKQSCFGALRGIHRKV